MKNNKLLLKVIGNLDVAVASIMLAALVILTSTGVVMRYVVGNPLTWLEEVQLFCMVWIVFCASGAAFRTGSHVAIEMVYDLLPNGAQKVASVFIDMVVLAVLSYLFYQSIGFIKMFVDSGRTTNMLGIPYWFIYGIGPISFVLMIVNFFYAKYVQKEPDAPVEEAS